MPSFATADVSKLFLKVSPHAVILTRNNPVNPTVVTRGTVHGSHSVRHFRILLYTVGIRIEMTVSSRRRRRLYQQHNTHAVLTAHHTLLCACVDK